MKKLLTFLPVVGPWLAWAFGSWICYSIWGTQVILPYAAVTIALVVFLVWRANRKPNAK